MAQPFILKLTDNVETVDFMSSSFKVADGGFNISLPKVKREFAPQRPGFYVPSIERYEYRESTITFDVRGATRKAVLTNLEKIERIIRQTSLRMRLTAGRRGELQYAWAGSDNITYFEVFGAVDISFPADILSVERMHRTDDAGYIVPGLELKLYLSSYGYSVSLYSDTLTEVPLYNPSVGSKQTGGVRITNPGNDTRYHWVHIAGTDLSGSQPHIMKMSLESDTPYDKWKSLYIGLQASPFPTDLIYDDYDRILGGNPPTNQTGANPSDSGANVTYRRRLVSSGPFGAVQSFMSWQLANAGVGIFYSFLHTWAGIDTDLQLAIGIDDYLRFGLQYQGDFVKSAGDNQKVLPLGPIQIPPADPSLKDYGTIHPDLWLTLFGVNDGSVEHNLDVDYISMLPIGGGLRIWKARVVSDTALTGTFYDDGWRGLEYIKSGSNVWVPFYGLMEPLKLEAGVDQRLYFTAGGIAEGAQDERQRAFDVRVWTVPTHLSLAT